MMGKCKVLIIDDCEEDREAYRRYLQQNSSPSPWEFDIVALDSAEDALALCDRDRFDVVLLDYDLPDLSGLEFLAWSKAHSLSSTAIIMLSAYGNESLAVQALKQGAQDYIVKQSVNGEMLRHSIRSSLEQVRLRQELLQSQDRQRLIATIALRIRDSLSLDQVLETSASEIRKLLKCDRALVFQLLPEKFSYTVMAESVESDVSSVRLMDQKQSIFSAQACSVAEEPSGNLKTLDCHAVSQEQSVFVIEDLASLSDDCPERAILLSLQIKSLIQVPIWIECADPSHQRLWGFLVLHHCRATRPWPSLEQEMLQELCVHLAIAIQQSELLTQTQCALMKEQELNLFKSKIVATVSHEYRTPITSILASASTLERHAERLDAHQNQRLLQLIAQQARHLRELVDDMLVVNQVELGQIQFKPFSLNLEQFFLRLIEEYRVLAQANQTLILEMQTSVENFLGDFGLCKQIFGNLMSNAIKYSPEGGIITLKIQDTETQVSISIRDPGIGIPEAEISQMFHSFTRGSNVDTITGTGLGLSIAKACVELHQGRIALQSKLNSYTEVTVMLPKQPRLTSS